MLPLDGVILEDLPRVYSPDRPLLDDVVLDVPIAHLQ
jgi:hypothetical protein